MSKQPKPHIDPDAAEQVGPPGDDREPDAAGAAASAGQAADTPAAGADGEAVEAGGAESAADGRGAEELRRALADAERASEQYLDHLRRERAEFENFRRRTTKERMEALDRGAEQVIANLLGVLDNFGYTLQAAESSEADDNLVTGLRMVHGQLVDVLGDAGLEEVPGVGATFDPNVHEAVEQVDAAEELGEPVDEPVVVHVMRPGYRFKGRVLRPAAVKVAK